VLWKKVFGGTSCLKPSVSHITLVYIFSSTTEPSELTSGAYRFDVRVELTPFINFSTWYGEKIKYELHIICRRDKLLKMSPSLRFGPTSLTIFTGCIKAFEGCRNIGASLTWWATLKHKRQGWCLAESNDQNILAHSSGAFRQLSQFRIHTYMIQFPRIHQLPYIYIFHKSNLVSPPMQKRTSTVSL